MKSKFVGAGLIVGAACAAYNRLRKPAPLEGSYADAATKILVVGGGFGGLAAARELARTLGGSHDVGVALLDRVNNRPFWPVAPRAFPINMVVGLSSHFIRPTLRPFGGDYFQLRVRGVHYKTSKRRITN